jgi:hypothetical protein
MWWTITGNFGNILPIDWSKSYARKLHMPALNLNENKVFIVLHIRYYPTHCPLLVRNSIQVPYDSCSFLGLRVSTFRSYILRHVDPLPSDSCVNRRQYSAAAREQLHEHTVSPATREHAIMEEKRFLCCPCRGDVFEYLHRSPASRRRRRTEKSRLWDSKIWSQVPRDSDPKMTALVRASRNCKRQTRPLVRESAPYQQNSNCLTIIKIWS